MTATSMTPALANDDIKFVLDLVKEAGDVAVDMLDTITVKEKTGPLDQVTSADIKLSEMLVEALRSRFPQDLLISEEDFEDTNRPVPSLESSPSGRVWMIDPIDGTNNYIKGEGEYAVMIGLLEAGLPTFGFVFAPFWNVSYFGGPGFGAWRQELGAEPVRFEPLPLLKLSETTRLMMGTRDRKRHPWVEQLPQVSFVKMGSIGIKVARILENHADLFVHLSGQLKTWDTAGPVAIALANNLDVGTMDADTLEFPPEAIIHRHPIIIGREGALAWTRKYVAEPAAEAT